MTNQEEDNLTYICLWKKLLNDKKSTSGMDMRKRDLPCKHCTGSAGCGSSLNCKKFLLFKQVRTK